MPLAAKFNIVIPPQDVADHPYYLKRIAEGDELAFAWLYKNYCRRVYDYVVVLTGDETSSEDVVQEIFMNLWMNRESLKEVNNFNGYVFRAAKNYLLNLWNKEAKLSKCIEEVTQQSNNFILNDCLYRETDAMINQTLSKLFPRQLQIFQLAKEEGLSRQQISEHLNISSFTVKATLQKVVKKLKDELNVE